MNNPDFAAFITVLCLGTTFYLLCDLWVWIDERNRTRNPTDISEVPPIE